jgi:hypothetical protein
MQRSAKCLTEITPRVSGGPVFPLPEPVYESHVASILLFLQRLCEATQLALRSEETTFEFVKKKQKTKNNKSPKPNKHCATRDAVSFSRRLPQYGAVGRESLATDGMFGTSPVF